MLPLVIILTLLRELPGTRNTSVCSKHATAQAGHRKMSLTLQTFLKHVHMHKINLVFLHKVVHVDAYIVWATPTLCGLLSKVYPSDRSKVSGLSTVQSGIEARVVAIRKGNDKVASFLGHLEWMNTLTNTHRREEGPPC